MPSYVSEDEAQCTVGSGGGEGGGGEGREGKEENGKNERIKRPCR